VRFRQLQYILRVGGPLLTKIMMPEGNALIPLIGLGTGRLRGSVCTDIVERALRLGYRHIDTAEGYENEREVGQGLHASGVRREDIFVTTKISPSHFAPRELERAAKDSLVRLRLSEIDLLLLHFPNPQVPLSETLEALCKVKRAGLTRHIGVSNFEVADIHEAVQQANEPLVCNQIAMNSFVNCPALTAACRAHHMAIVAYSPIARGEANNDAVLKRIGQVYGKSSAQVSLQWLVQQEISVIPRTSRIDHLSENYSIFDFELSEAEMSEISSIARRRKQLATVMSPLRAFALKTLPAPATSVLHNGYRMLRRVIFG
jgi:2,5-diketo-D-gluconate reductase B